MSDSRKNLIKNLIVNFVVGLLVVVFVYMTTKDYGYEVFHNLHNGCFCAGILLFGAGVILFCSNRGAFNLFGYSAKYAINLILPMGNNPWRATGERETYYDYCQRMAEKPAKEFVPLLIVGGGYILISVVFVLLHYYL